MRHLALWGTIVTGCANTVAGTRGEAPDAARPTNFELTVLGDLSVPGAPGVDVPVRVTSRERGAVIDARTGADGRVLLQLDPSQTWDVTAARAGLLATSLLGARMPFRTVLRLPPQVPAMAPDTRRQSVAVTITGRSAPRSAVVLDGATGSTVARDDTVTLSVPSWRGAPADYFISAVELDAASNFLRGGFAAVPSRATAGPVTVALSLRPRDERFRVEFPFVGRVTPSTFAGTSPGSVLRFKQTELGEGAAPVGRAELAPPDDTGTAWLTLTRFDAPLDPELSTVTYTARGGLEGTVTLQPAFVGLVPAVAPVERLVTRATAPGAFAFTADTGVWSRAYFELRSDDGTVRWRGFALDAAPWSDLALPSLPAGVALADIVGVGLLRAHTCVARDAPQMGQVPWAHTRPPLSMWSRLSVCDAGAVTVAR